jgi:hypothetical protein
MSEKFPISKIPKPKITRANFHEKWKLASKELPEIGDRIYALVIKDKILYGLDGSIEDKEDAEPYIGRFLTEGDDNCLSFFHLKADGSYYLGKYSDDDEEQKVILTQDYSIIMWIKEEEYWKNVCEINKGSSFEKGVFVKEIEGSYDDAFNQARNLTQQDPNFNYYVWDCR